MHMPVCIIFLMILKHGLYLMRFHCLLSNQYQLHIYIVVLEFMSHTMSLVSRSANLYFLYFHPSTSGIVDMKLRWWMTKNIITTGCFLSMLLDLISLKYFFNDKGNMSGFANHFKALHNDVLTHAVIYDKWHYEYIHECWNVIRKIC